MRQMKKVKHELKQKQIDDEKLYFDKTKQLDEKHQKKQKFLVEDNERDLTGMEKKYQQKLNKMKQEL